MVDLHEIVCEIDRFCFDEGIEHRFVGGVAYSGLLTPETTFEVAIPKRTVWLRGHKNLPLLRDDGTVRDIDLITFERDHRKIEALKIYCKELARNSHLERKFPFVSVENAVFNEGKKHSRFLQFVYSIFIAGDRFGQGQAFLVYENIREKISWESLEPWTVILEDGRKYTVRNPYGDLLGYMVRTPIGFKPKDREKLALMRPLVDLTIKQGKTRGVDYNSEEFYGPWLRFFDRMTTAGGTVGLKREIIKSYWDLFGTKLVHGRGPVAKVISKLGNQLTGTRQ